MKNAEASNNDRPKSLKTVLGDLAWRANVLLPLLCIGLFSAFAIALNYQTQVVICGLVESQLDEVSAPIARELALGVESIGREIFSDFQDALKKKGIKEDLRLIHEKQPPSSASAHRCQPRFFDAIIARPISFADEPQGTIMGKVRYDYNAFVIILPLIMICVIIFSIRLLTGQIFDFTRKLIIDPIIRISVGTPLNSKDLGVSEIVQIEKNIERLKTRISKQVMIANEADKAIQLSNLASQVAHDIRSPLAALSAAVPDLFMLPEDTRIMVRSAIGRIQDIANHLLEKNRSSMHSGSAPCPLDDLNEQSRPTLLSGLLEAIVTEKRMQYRSKIGIQIDASLQQSSSYGLFGMIQPNEFKRVISNLVNNAAESLPDGNGKILITLESKSNRIQIRVSDNGKGIPQELLSRLTQRGETHGKTGGSGLGLYHARTSLEHWGGTLVVESALDRGTSVRLTIPRSESPQWFVDQITLSPHSPCIVVDDDQSVHQIWQGRLDSLKAKDHAVDALHFSTPGEFREWRNAANFDATKVVCLVDYELAGFQETGLDLIEALDLAGQSILVTSRYEEAAIRERCLRLGIRLLPKGMAGFVPMTLPRELNGVDAVLITC